MDSRLTSPGFKIKIILLDIFPSIKELSNNEEELTIIFQGLRTFYNLSEIISEKTEIIIPNCQIKNSIIISINKLDNIFATGVFNIKQGEQWLKFVYENKATKKFSSNLALSLIDCIKIKVFCELQTEIINHNTNITVNTLSNSINHTINNFISSKNNINNTISTNNGINYSNSTVNINNNLCNYKKNRVSINQLRVKGSKKNFNNVNINNSNIRSTNNILSRASPQRQNNNELFNKRSPRPKKSEGYINLNFTSLEENYLNNKNSINKSLNPNTTVNKKNIKKIELTNINNSLNRSNNKTRNSKPKINNISNNSSLSSFNELSSLRSANKANNHICGLKKLNTSLGNLNTINPRPKKSTANFRVTTEFPEIEVKEIHNYFKNSGSPNHVNLNKIYKDSYKNVYNNSNVKKNNVDNFLESLDNILDTKNKLNAVNNNNKNNQKPINANTNYTTDNINNVKKKIGPKISKGKNSKKNFNNNNNNIENKDPNMNTKTNQKNKIQINQENKNIYQKQTRLNTLNNYSIPTTTKKIDYFDVPLHSKEDTENNNKTLFKSKNNSHGKSNENKEVLTKNIQKKISSKIESQNTISEENVNIESDKKIEEVKNFPELEKESKISKNEITTEEELDEDLIANDYFNNLKEDFVLLYNEEYVNNIQDDLLKLEIELFIEKMCELITVYHNQMKDKKLENEILENNVKQNISNIREIKKLNTNLDNLKFNNENNTKNNKKSVKKLEYLNIDINLKELKILQNVFSNKKEEKKMLKDIIMLLLQNEENRMLLIENESFMKWVSLQEKKTKIKNKTILTKTQTKFNSTNNNSNITHNNGNDSYSFHRKENAAYRKKAPPISPIYPTKIKHVPLTELPPEKITKNLK